MLGSARFRARESATRRKRRRLKIRALGTSKAEPNKGHGAGLPAGRKTKEEQLEAAGIFEEFCRSFVGKDKRYVHRLIQAHGVIEDLMLEGVKESDLPNSERICRELASYPISDMSVNHDFVGESFD